MSIRLHRSSFRFSCLLAALFLTAACGNKAGQARVGSDSSSDGSNGGGGTTTPVTSGSQDFRLNATFTSPNTIVSYMHDKASADWSKSCSVSQSSASVTTPQLISCILEAHELDVYMTPITLNFDVPAGMCDYVEIAPYWFWKDSAGVGPTSFTINTDANGNKTISNVVNATNSTLTASLVGGSPVCTGDHTAIDGGANCCEGTYVQTEIVTPASPATPTTTYTKASWGGKIGNCAAGAAETFSAGREKLHSIPRSLILPTLSGVSSIAGTKFDIATPLSLQLGSVLYNANYLNSADTVPSLLQPVTLPSGQKIYPNPFYLYHCLDAAYEHKAVIGLQIRKWNLVSQLLLKSAGSWNMGGSEATPGQPNNDFPGWEDAPQNSTLLQSSY